MYSSSAFARITGVTLKALRHYERLGLIRPKRTGTGYRRYSPADVLNLERVLALKTLGLPLATIRTLATGKALSLTAHRESLEAKRDTLDRAIATLKSLEEQPRLPDALGSFVREAAWDRWEARRQQLAATTPRAPDRASETAIQLFRNILTAADAGATRDQASALAERCRDILMPETLEYCRNRGRWPSGMRRYVASLYRLSPDEWDRALTFVEAAPQILRS